MKFFVFSKSRTGYLALTDQGIISFSTSLSLDVGGYEGKIENGMLTEFSPAEVDLETLVEKVIQRWKPLAKIPQKVKERIKEFAKKLLYFVRKGFFIILRFHNDADGIVGAYALSKIIRAQKVQHNSAFYTVKDALEDLTRAKDKNKLLVILVDFGSNEESKDGLRILKVEGASYLVVDHHPTKAIDEYVLNSWSLSADSRITAGYLCVEIARCLGVKENWEFFAKISLAGDKSDLLPISEEEKRYALVLDYLSTYGNNYSAYVEALENKKFFNEVYLQAQEKMEEIRKVVKKVATKKAGVVYLNIDKIYRETGFPSSGKIASLALEEFGGVVIAKARHMLIFRIAADEKVSALCVIRKLEELGYGRGGGHEKAAAFRCAPAFVDLAVEEALKLVIGFKKEKIDYE